VESDEIRLPKTAYRQTSLSTPSLLSTFSYCCMSFLLVHVVVVQWEVRPKETVVGADASELVSWLLNTGSVSLGLKGSGLVTFLTVCYDKIKQIHTRVVYTSLSLLSGGSGEREINSLGIFSGRCPSSLQGD